MEKIAFKSSTQSALGNKFKQLHSYQLIILRLEWKCWIDQFHVEGFRQKTTKNLRVANGGGGKGKGGGDHILITQDNAQGIIYENKVQLIIVLWTAACRAIPGLPQNYQRN